nr:hypothetical protein [Tanacetum cinerariifolium]
SLLVVTEKKTWRKELYGKWQHKTSISNPYASNTHHLPSRSDLNPGLSSMDENMIDATNGGALVHKTPTEVRTQISNMAANSQKFGTRQDCPTKRVSEVKTSYDQRLDNLTALVEKLVMGSNTQ